MTPFRQLILPGDVGTDVLAVKRAMRKMGIKGSGGLVLSRRAGPAFVTVLDRVLHAHGLPSDGKYGPKAHAVIAPHFDLYGVSLYKRAAIRTRLKPVTKLTTMEAAQRLLKHANAGKYHADNPGDMRDLKASAAGQAVWSQGGRYVHIDPRVFELLCWLIEEHSYTIGTFAFCSDHHFDGWRGHSGGKALDISSINGVSIAANSSRSRTQTLGLAKVIHIGTPAVLHPWQEICGGFGYQRDSEISHYSIPGADSFYGGRTMAQHCNHIHVGFS